VSDFLSHLAGRSLGPTNTVRPRLLPIFDPLQPFYAPEWRGAQSSVSAAVEPPFLGLELKAAPSEIDRNSAPLNRPPPPAGPRFGADPSRVAARVDAAALSEPERQPRTAEIVPDNSSTEHPIPATNGTRDAPHFMDPSPARSRPISPFNDPRAEKGKPSVHDREKILTVTNGLPHATRPAETNLVAVRSSPARPVASLMSRPPASSQSLRSESAINVTIGRVEIRATLPPVATQTSRRNAPIVSLDEYLRQRAKGAGR
jgi:hypothetical protein